MGKQNQALSAALEAVDHNHNRSKVRAPVMHGFGLLQNSMDDTLIHTTRNAGSGVLIGCRRCPIG